MKNNAPHIGHILPYEGIGGTEHATLQLARAAQQAGFSNTFFVLEECGEVRRFFEKEDFPVESYPKIEFGLRSPLEYLRRSNALAAVFRRRRLDLIHCADFPAAERVALAGLRAGVPVISHVRNRHEAIRTRDRLILRLIKNWLFVSENTRANFPLKVPMKRTAVLYDGIETSETDEAVRRENSASIRREFRIAPDAKIVGTLARVAPQKDFFTLAKAVKSLKEKGKTVVALIVGSTSQEAAHRAHFREVSEFLDANGVGENFIFTDFRADTVRFLHAFDIFVLSTHYEGFPLVNLEAMAQRLPVVATDVDGVAEAIRNGENGFLYAHEDAAQLAEILEKLIDDAEFARRIGEAGFARVQAEFSRRKYTENVLGIYRRILAQ